jgi:hypothetical protein
MRSKNLDLAISIGRTSATKGEHCHNKNVGGRVKNDPTKLNKIHRVLP